MSALSLLPPVQGFEYELYDPFVQEYNGRFWAICTYQLAGVGEDEAVTDEHVSISANFHLYPEWALSPNQIYRPLPISSDDLDDWLPLSTVGRVIEPWREGCEAPCGQGEESTVQTVGHRFLFTTHAGNLEFYVRVVYGAQQLPPSVREKTVAIFRDLVLATIDHYPQVVAGNRRVAEVAG